VTAALFASSGEQETDRVEVVCEIDAPQFVVQLSSGQHTTSSRTIHIRSRSACGESVHVDVAKLNEQMDEARARMEEARARMDESRVRVEDARGLIEMAQVRVQEAREVREIARLHVEGVEADLIEVEELRTDELRAALEKLAAEAERVRAAGGND
jgi:chromosome segregation ATPase